MGHWMHFVSGKSLKFIIPDAWLAFCRFSFSFSCYLLCFSLKLSPTMALAVEMLF